VKLDYPLELKDYKAALRLHATNKLARRLSHYFWYIAVPVLAVFGLALLIFAGLWQTLDIDSPYRWIVGALLWLSIFLPLMRFINTRRCFKLLIPASAKDRNVSLEVNDEYIVSEIPGVSAGKFFWNPNMTLSQNKEVVLIYVAKKRFIPVPASFLSLSQMGELRAIFERNVVRK
jgi:hypothetical protein